MNEKQLKRIILEEIQRVLSEEVLPPAPRNPPTAVSMQSQQRPPAPNTISDTGQMTTDEAKEQKLLDSMEVWGKQLTTVKYRQFLQDIMNAPGYGGSNGPLYKMFLSAAGNATSNKTNIKEATLLKNYYSSKGHPVISQALRKSGYEDLSTYDHY